ncbi:hypothetical protein [Turicibacter sanguinis]|nr:hypothetical protein [Turicibacter sanguinis]
MKKHQDEKAFKLQTDYEDFILYVKTICNAYIVAGGVINDHADDESWQSLTAQLRVSWIYPIFIKIGSVV